MRRRTLAFGLLAATLCTGSPALSAQPSSANATSVDRSSSPEFWSASIVTAKGASTKPGVVEQASEYFNSRGQIYAHATLVARGPFVPLSATFTFKWFNKDNLKRNVSAPHTVNESPLYVVHAVPGSVLGPGNCRVELYLGERLVAQREFTVAER